MLRYLGLLTDDRKETTHVYYGYQEDRGILIEGSMVHILISEFTIQVKFFLKKGV